MIIVSSIRDHFAYVNTGLTHKVKSYKYTFNIVYDKRIMGWSLYRKQSYWASAIQPH